MTFQVGIVGLDGVLLASDLKHALDDGHSIRTSHHKSKLRASTEIACCASGREDVAMYAARLCVAESSASSITERLEHSAERAMQAHASIFADNPNLFCGTLLTAHLENDRVNLYQLNLQRPLIQACRILTGHVYAGDRTNAAVFFLEQYEIGQRSPIANYCLLAAHAVLSAARLNPTGIGGLEIMLCRPSGFERVSETQIAELSKLSLDLDNAIRSKLGIPVPAICGEER